MDSAIKKINPLGFAFLLLIFFCSINDLFAQINHSKKIENEEALRAAIIKVENTPDFELPENFAFVDHQIDLNGDGRNEIIVWMPEPLAGGTSGYPVMIFSQTQSGYKKVWYEEQAWTPIIALKTQHNGWRDLALQYGGGGATWHYGIFRHDGKSYRIYKTQKIKPQGDILIDKDWNQTVLGPIPNQ